MHYSQAEALLILSIPKRAGDLLEQPRRYQVDPEPWHHPFLTKLNISRFRNYSEAIWQEAMAQRRVDPKNLRFAFCVNMAQNMYKWAIMAQRQGADVTVFLHPMDKMTISAPEWEEFDGEFEDLYNCDGFKERFPSIQPHVKIIRPVLDGKWLKKFARRRLFLPALKFREPKIKHAELLNYPGMEIYYEWAKELSRYSASFIASNPFPAFASGKPYFAVGVGGDLQYDCVRNDYYGEVIRRSFANARFLLISNPHALAHCRRLGFTNAIYLPHPMDEIRYCPGIGKSREAWEAIAGKGVYVLTTSRLDKGAKGFDQGLAMTMVRTVRELANVRFVLISWGENAKEFRSFINELGMNKHFIFVKPVGKQRLIDYYRSCDFVLDQFVYGYYGATALEAAACGKPVVMKTRDDQYDPLYKGDISPVENVSDGEEIFSAIRNLTLDEKYRTTKGEMMRAWLIRTHGSERTVPLMIGLLSMTARKAKVPRDLDNPLLDPLSSDEILFHDQPRKNL